LVFERWVTPEEARRRGRSPRQHELGADRPPYRPRRELSRSQSITARGSSASFDGRVAAINGVWKITNTTATHPSRAAWAKVQ